MSQELLLGARRLLGAPGLITRSKKLLGAPGIATRSKDGVTEVLDFGNVYVKSTVVKSFSVFNDLPQARTISRHGEAGQTRRILFVSFKSDC